MAKPHHTVRPASAAGLYYPGEADGLRLALRTLLGATTGARTRLPKALIVPHAGYGYSGSVAAAGYRLLDTPAATAIRHVVLLGPSHRVAIRGLAMPSWNFYSTPCGATPVDETARTRLRELSLAGIDDAPHALEHSFEVQLPFLQATLQDFDLLPIAVGTVQAEQVCRALEAVWGGPETLVVVSSDLSHHHTHVEATALDGQTARLIVARRSDLADAQACGAGAINGLMECARHKGLEVRQLDRRTSGDTGGDDSRVVGYGSFALFDS
ncbi:MAG: AmmeMemoRadiSam system protein B [Steroidobacteraceae bacterium]